MRYNEFILEAAILNEASWQKYGPGTFFTISDGIAGKKLLAAIESAYATIGPDDYLEKVGPREPGKKILVPFGRDSGEYLFVKTKDGQLLKIAGSSGTIGTALNHAGSKTGGVEGEAKTSKVNLGDISEGVLGAALYAKLLARSRDGIVDITEENVWQVLDQGTQSTEVAGMVWREQSADIGGALDTIKFRMRIKAQAARALKDPNNFKKINDTIVGSSVSFVNGRYGTKYAEAIYLNRKADEIEIVSDGMTDQKADPITGLVKKTDVFITSKNEEGKPIKERLPISLKAGSSVKQFGQVSGKTFDKMIGLLKPFNIDVASLQDKWNKIVKGSNQSADSIRGAMAIFPDIAAMINKKLTGPAAEANFVHNIASAIHYYASSNDPKVRLVQLIGANKVHVLNTNLLFEKISSKHINLEAFAKVGDGTAKITIKDVNSGKPLISLRSYHTDNAQRNIIEMEKLMKELCGVEWDREFGKEKPKDNTPVKPSDTGRVEPTNVAAPAKKVPTAKPAYVAPPVGKDVNTLQGGEWTNTPDNREPSVGMGEEIEDKDMSRLRKLAGIKNDLSKGI
jgi:hypothetical protein